jgi:hypothetical protein
VPINFQVISIDNGYTCKIFTHLEGDTPHWNYNPSWRQWILKAGEAGAQDELLR